MNMKLSLSVVALLWLMQGCGNETVKRSAFETLQNVQRQQCLTTMEQGCPERESYDRYQRQRDEQKRGE
jgi:hypothetical protein